MTHRAVGFGRGFPRIWLVPIGALTLLLGIAATGRLSRSIVADLIAWWPVWVGLGIAAYVFRERKLGAIRVAGVIPLVALFFVILFAWGHLAGWALMPSAAQRLVGPETGTTTDASLQVEIDGVVQLSGGSEYLYQVEPVKRGGGFGIPGAAEQVVDSSVSIVLSPPADPGLYTFAGWDITVSDEPRWRLTLGGAVDADLTTLSVTELTLSGGGTVRLGPTNGEAPAEVEGSYRLVIADDVPARVNGIASVPSTWIADAGGATSPAGGDGWVISVASGATVNVVSTGPASPPSS
jgi:hypothetical protein